MSKVNRIKDIIIGITVMIMSAFMLVFPDMGHYLTTIILGIVLLMNGIKQFIYFFSMGIHMIGGKIILYRALITIDLSFFLLSIQGIGQRYMMVYFAVYYFFAGVITMFRAYESRKVKAGLWKWKILIGVFKVAIAVLCIVNN